MFPDAVFVTASTPEHARLIHKTWCDFFCDRDKGNSNGMNIHIKIDGEGELYYLGESTMNAQACISIDESVSGLLNICSGFAQYVVSKDHVISILKSDSVARFNRTDCLGKDMSYLEQQIHQWRAPLIDLSFRSNLPQIGERKYIDDSHPVLREWMFVETFYPSGDFCIIDVADPPSNRGFFQKKLWELP